MWHQDVDGRTGPARGPGRPQEASRRVIPGESSIVLLIGGMRDNGCREAVVEALTGVPGVLEADVSLFKARATVVFCPPCEREHLVSAVARVGYRAVSSADT